MLPHEAGTVRLDTLLEGLGERLPRLLPGRIDVTIAGGSAGVVALAHDAVEEALADLLFLVLPRGSWTHELTLEATAAPSEDRLRLIVRRRDCDLVGGGFVRYDLVRDECCQQTLARLAELGIRVRHQDGSLAIDLPALPALSALDGVPALLAAA